MVLEQQRRSLLPGTRFGRYEVLTDIAAGGMAMVYLGRALGAAGFQRLVAIKVMHAQYAHDQEFVAMFLDEARLAARIHHPNVVATLDLENDQDGLYLVMEYVEGDTLLSLLKQSARAGRRIAQPIAIRIVLDMLAGLHAAHELKDPLGEPLHLVHRDVSPHNVLVGLDGIARITDFGIARAEERLSTTRNGQVKGKLSYMAPEQTTSEQVTRRADLFTTGVVLWETLAGRRLFNGQSDGEVYRKLIDTPIPRLSEVLAEVPPALDEVVSKALARDPAHRFASGAEFADALELAAAAVGIASQRTVAQFVQQLAGERLEAMRARVREVRASNPGPDTSASISAVRTMSGRGSVAPVVPSVPPPLPTAALQSVPPGAVASFPPPAVAVESSPKRLWLVALLIGLVAAIASAVGVVFALKHTPRDPAPSPATTVTASPATATPAVQPAAIAQPETPSALVDGAVPEQPAADLTFEPGSVPSERTPRPRPAAPRTNGTTGSNPTPPANPTPPSNPTTPPAGNGSRQYNPEWM